MERLSDAFEGAQFAADEVAKSVHWDRPNPKAVEHVDYLIAAVQELRKGLEERGVEEFYERDVALLEYPLRELRKFLNKDPGALSEVTGAHIFARFVHEQLQALQQFADEIDANDAA